MLHKRHANWRDAVIADAMLRLPQRRTREHQRAYTDRCVAYLRALTAPEKRSTSDGNLT